MKNSSAKKYYYNGPYKIFDRIVGNFTGETTASSPEAAMRNLTYQCKVQKGYLKSSKLTLTGEVRCAE